MLIPGNREGGCNTALGVLSVSKRCLQKSWASLLGSK